MKQQLLNNIEWIKIEWLLHAPIYNQRNIKLKIKISILKILKKLIKSFKMNKEFHKLMFYNLEFED